MTTGERGGPRRAPHETAGSVDHPYDDDRPSGQQLIRSDAACAIPWLQGEFQALQVFVDPAVRDRSEQVCETLTALCTQHSDLDELNQAIQSYARENGLSAGLYEEPPDRLSEGVVAVTFTVG